MRGQDEKNAVINMYWKNEGKAEIHNRNVYRTTLMFVYKLLLLIALLATNSTFSVAVVPTVTQLLFRDSRRYIARKLVIDEK